VQTIVFIIRNFILEISFKKGYFMKMNLLAAIIIALSGTAKAANQKISFHLSSKTEGIYPAGILTLVNSVATKLVAEEITKYCGERPDVTDLQFNTTIQHNQVPGTATIAVEGSGSCTIID